MERSKHKRAWPRPDMHSGRFGGGRCYPIRHSDTLRQHVRSDETVSRCHRKAVGQRSAGGKGGERVHELRYPARRAGVDDSELPHHVAPSGFIIVGLPYTFQGQMRIDEITGGSPYGASTIAGGQGERMPSANELEAARYQGRHVATIASKLAK